MHHRKPPSLGAFPFMSSSTPSGQDGTGRLFAFRTGTQLLTGQGERAIETVQPGDRIITRGAGIRNVRDVLEVAMPSATPQVHIPAGALGHGRPQRDMMVGLDHMIVLRGTRVRMLYDCAEAHIPAARLVDGQIITITPAPASSARALLMDTPSVLYTDGLEMLNEAPKADAPGKWA